MNKVKQIRLAVGETQAEFAAGIGCTQPNIVFLENHGQDPSIETAYRIIRHVARKGMHLTLDDIYTAPELTEPQQEV